MPLDNFGSGRWNEESERKRENPEKTYAHGVCPPQNPNAHAGFEPTTPSVRDERSNY